MDKGETLESLVVEEHPQQSELELFRQSWANEVAEKKFQLETQKTLEASKKDEVCTIQESKTLRARKLFQQGIDSERSKQLHNAIQYYRMALQLDPDIEQRMFNEQESSEPLILDNTSSDSDVGTSTDLLEKFSALAINQTYKKSANTTMPKDMHITQLPSEVLSTIFRWIASSDTDMKSVENMSMTCRKFYVLSRDPVLWKAACKQVGLLKQKSSLSWRQMFIGCLYPRVDGVYISKISYFREGDPTVMCTHYQPFQCVEYYRYIRFFSSGQMIMHTTAEEPALAISKLTLENVPMLNCRVGRYKMHGQQQKTDKAKVSSILTDTKSHNLPHYPSNRRSRQREEKYIITDTEYYLDLELSSSSFRKRSNKLTWMNYSSQCKFGGSGRTSFTEYSLRDQYPPFYFSVVKSFTKYAVASL